MKTRRALLTSRNCNCHILSNLCRGFRVIIEEKPKLNRSGRRMEGMLDLFLSPYSNFSSINSKKVLKFRNLERKNKKKLLKKHTQEVKIHNNVMNRVSRIGQFRLLFSQI